jgi:NADH-quinone oxidoreductase subunit A
MLLSFINSHKKKMILNSYVYLILFIVICTCLSTLLYIIAKLCSPTRKDYSKLSAYECGFDPFDTTRSQFEVHFFLIALIFLIFDLEILYLFP